MATIATHNGSSVSRGHNMRKDEIVSKESHIDPDGIHESWHDEASRQAYERLFGQAVREYNQKQTRTDRKIDNYYNEVRDDQRRHVTYEMIIGIYPGENETISESTGKEIMRDFVDTWKSRNPNLELVGAYYHADEQGKAPHVHIDYIPVAHGYKRGPTVQNGLVKALGEMGFVGTARHTAQIQWEKRENEVLEALCNSRGIAVEHPEAGNGVKHLHTQIYKAEKDLEKLEEKYRELENEPPVQRVVEVEKEVLIEKVVEVEKNYKTMAEKALNAFRVQSEWLRSKGLSVEAYHDLCHDMDYLQTNKTVYPRNRARVAPLRPDDANAASAHHYVSKR